MTSLLQGPTFPAMHAILAVWVPDDERTKIGAFVYAGVQLGTVIVLSISGWLADNHRLGGWRAVFYIFGILGCVWYVVWSLVVYDTPAKHPHISAAELHYIESRVGATGPRASTPWRDMARSPAFWSLTIVHITYSWQFYMMLAFMPMYMEEVLKFDISQNGMVCAMPYAINWAMMIMSGYVADYMRSKKILSTASVRKLFNVLGLMLPAIFLVSATYAGCRKVLAVVLLTAAAGVSGVAVAAGYGVNHLDIAPRFAGTMMGITNSLGCISGVLGPMVVGFLTSTTSNILQWRKVFFTCLGVSFVGSLVTLGYTSGEEEPWAKVQVQDLTPGGIKSTKTKDEIRNWVITGSCVLIAFVGKEASPDRWSRSSAHGHAWPSRAVEGVAMTAIAVDSVALPLQATAVISSSASNIAQYSRRVTVCDQL
ncbi:Sialin [Lamellibrachia satsuma]|nr:Sialin [Lamellibrachia satsuma]